MPRDPRVDRKIAAAPVFARPILERFRELVHEACPDVVEDLKWGRPSFLYKGKLLCSVAAFKAHCVAGFWHQEMGKILANDGISREGAGGLLGKITKVSDLPPKGKLMGYVRQACRLIDDPPEGVVTRKRSAPKPEAEAPADLAKALAKNKAAAKTFAGFSPSNRREYIEWITEAKREETRQKRVETAVEWMAEGKVRNWKYMNC